MNDINDRISAVLADRRRLLPGVDREIAAWERVRDRLGDLGGALAAVRDGPDSTPAGLDEIDLPASGRRVAEVLAALAAVRARVSRQTLNIGVSGRARNGKSTLLQSMTGLTDEQIPAGSGLPVTAVRSRISHSPAQREAVLTMHSESSFCEEVLSGYHEELKLPSPPRTIQEFAGQRYPATSAELGVDPDSRPKAGPMLVRLREMQESVESFRGWLTGDTHRVDLEDLRGWVAYPPPGDSRPDRRYLAVRDARILCRFPVDEVNDLELRDMPGLGELTAGAEQHHLSGLKNDVDFVLIVKRPSETNAAWFAEDAAGLGLIIRAAGAVTVQDFVAILVNEGGCPPGNVEALLTDISKRVNEGGGGSAYRTIVADAADPGAVREKVLVPVLGHLAEALPRMDGMAIDHAVELSSALRGQLLAEAKALQGALRSVMTPNAVEELLQRAKQLRAELAVAIQAWVAQLRVRAAENYEDDEFFRRVESLQNSVREWAVEGFHDGVDGWRTRALNQMLVDDASLAFATRELNDIRNEVARRLSTIDELLNERRDEFWAGLVAALGPRLAPVAEGTPPGDALRDLAVRLQEAPEPCPELAGSLEFVLDLRLDYRTRVLPRMRTVLNGLRPEPDGQDPVQMTALLTVPRTPDGAGELFTRLSHLVRQAAHEAGGILAEEPAIAAQVLLAYAEQFEDAFIRSAGSEAEFRRMAEAFRDELWPGRPEGPALATARVQHLRSVLRDLVAALDTTAVRQERNTR